MLEKILDNKNTFEGKVLNVFLAVVLVLSLSNLSAFAQDGTQGSSAQTAGTQQSDGTIADGASSTNEQAVQGVLQHGSDAVAGDASAEQASPIASSEVNEAVVTFETNHAYVSVKDQILYAKTLTTELHKELKFVASADTGYQVGEIKAKNSSNADVPVTTQDGISVIAADYVDSTLVISVSAVSVGAEAPSGNETKPITNNTLIGVDEPGVAVIHTVTFTAEGSETQTQKIVDGSTCIEPITPAIPSGKVSFLGWYQKLASGELSADRFDFATAITSDIELVAKFSDKWAVLFTDNDGKVITTQEVSNNGTATNIGPITPPVGQSFDAWYLNGSPYNFSTPVTSNITLTPHFVTSRYIYFVSMGSAVAPQLVNDGQLAVQPPNPTREGYTFQFWSTSEDGSTGAYDFSKPVTSDLVLYGIWKGKTVNYVVVYNFEKANIPGDAGVSPDNYLFSEQNTLSAVAGTTVSAADLYATGKLAPSSGTDLAKYGYFAFGDTSTISGNGSTVLNVYYKRIMYTVQFDLNSSGKWMTFNGTTYNNGSTKYSFPAKYEQDIDSLWVSSKNATFWTSGSQGFAGWTNSKFSGTLVSHRLTMTSDIVAAADSSNIITAKATWANVTTSQVNYWLEIADYNNIPAGAVQKANGKWYSSNNEYTQRITLSGTLGPKSIGGFDKNTSYNESGWKNVGGTWVYTYDFYYDRLTYTLSFNTMGGSAISAISNIRYESPMSSYRPADPIRPNYVFKGWYLDSDYKIPYDFSSAIMPGSNVQLYAKWESSQYSANFYTHKGDATPLLSQGIAEGTFVKDPGTYVVGHPYDGLGEFLGWYWYLPGTDRLVSYSWETPVSGNVNLYAQWKTNGFTVTYDKGVGQGTVPVDSNTYALGSLAPVQGAQLTVAGKTFVGWQVDGAGRTYYPGNTIKMNGNVKLVARYINPSLAVTLTFNANYGLIPATEKWTAEKNDWVTLPTSMFDRAGYKFTGWNTKADGSGTSYSASSALLMTASVTLYAQWEIDFSSLDAKGFKKKYDGVAQSVTVTGALSTDVVEYYVGGHKVNNSFTNVNDSSDVTVKVTRDGKIWEKTVNVSITPAPLLVTTPNANKVYDGSALTAQGTLTGLVAGESAAFSTTGTQTKVGSSSNTYSLNWNGSAKQSNYSITESLGVLSVTEFAGNVVVATTGGIFTYDGNLHAATVKVTGLPSGYVVDKASSSTAATDATSSPIPATADTLVIKNADGEDVTSKLRVSYVNDTLVINPAAVTLTSQSLTKAYDTNPLTNGNTALATESGWAAGEGAT
ncbi:MAG: InlB B-repeat-containing protein, partial [Gordonibacter sp.]|nr:InlB B-repeat-containing protein [Gordonibacter sp.]